MEVSGVDLSPRMVEVARRDHPGMRFEVGSMAALPFGDAELAGALAWYSIIHTPLERQGELFAEFARVVRPGGSMLLAFQVGDDVVHITHAYGHEIDAMPGDRIRCASGGCLAGGWVRPLRGTGACAGGAREGAAGVRHGPA